MDKREAQRQRKEAKQRAARQREQKLALLQKAGLYGALPLLVLFVLFTLLSQGPTYSPVEIAPNDHVRGDPETPVSVVVYADFQCPACRTEYETMSELWPQINDQAHLVFRHYPLTGTHPHAWTAALYAEAAGLQNRFWAMHDNLFVNQPIWSGLRDAEAEFDSYALEMNLDLEQLHADMESDEVISKVRNDQRGGTAAGVRATPAVFVNGRILANPSRRTILDAITEAAAETSGD